MDTAECGLSGVPGMLGERDSIEVLKPFWQESMRTLPNPAPFFLNSKNLGFYCRFCGLAPSAEQKVQKTARRILDNQGLVKLPGKES